jgi:hypothetical protein
MHDIWDAPGLYEIPGPDGHPFISESHGNEGRYLFSEEMVLKTDCGMSATLHCCAPSLTKVHMEQCPPAPQTA